MGEIVSLFDVDKLLRTARTNKTYRMKVHQKDRRPTQKCLSVQLRGNNQLQSINQAHPTPPHPRGLGP